MGILVNLRKEEVADQAKWACCLLKKCNKLELCNGVSFLFLSQEKIVFSTVFWGPSFMKNKWSNFPHS